MRLILLITLICTPLFAQNENKTRQIQAVVKTEEWPGWGSGEPLPDGLKVQQTPEKFTRIPPTPDTPQKFSGKVTGLKPDQKADIGIIALKGTHWINNDNYEWSALDASRAFAITSQRNPDANKTLVIKTATGQWSFLRAEFAPREGATDIELLVKPPTKVVITMEDALGNAVTNFRGEVFNAYAMIDDQGHELRPQRYGNPISKSGAMMLELPPEPFGVLLYADKVAPYYEIIDPREAGRFNFKMLASCRIRGTVTRAGKPAANEGVFMVNNAAPMSATKRKTDNIGRFDIANRVPGIQHLVVGDYETDIPVKPGETTDLKIDLGSAAYAPAPAK
jgi:hypothetical protein